MSRVFGLMGALLACSVVSAQEVDVGSLVRVVATGDAKARAAAPSEAAAAPEKPKKAPAKKKARKKRSTAAKPPAKPLNGESQPAAE